MWEEIVEIMIYTSFMLSIIMSLRYYKLLNKIEDLEEQFKKIETVIYYNNDMSGLTDEEKENLKKGEDNE